MSRSEYDAHMSLQTVDVFTGRRMPRRRPNQWLSLEAFMVYAMWAGIGVMLAWRG
jgi:hypothetical protein